MSWVKDGVSVCKETRLDSFPPGLHGVASCWGLELDASQFALVRNEAYTQRLGEIVKTYEGKRLS